MNHCILEVEVKKAPTVRYTQDNKTPIAEMEVFFDGLRADDERGEIRVIGWGNMAQELQNQIEIGQRLVLEGRLRMNTTSRQDGTKEKKAELTLSRFHLITQKAHQANSSRGSSSNNAPQNNLSQPSSNSKASPKDQEQPQNVSWDSSPLVPDTDDIPF